MEELEMYETLEYIKDRFEGENEGLKFSYLGVDEKEKIPFTNAWNWKRVMERDY